MNNILETIKTPQESVNDDSVVIVQLYVKNGDKVDKDQILAEIETSKANIDIHSQEEGYVKCLCEENQDVLIGEILFEIYSNKLNSNKAEPKDDKIKEKKIDQKIDIPIKNFKTKFSKGAEKLISNNNIDKNNFKGLEFVTLNEVKNFLNPNHLSTNKSIDTQIVETFNIDNSLIEKELSLGKKKLNEIKYLSNINSTGLVSRLTIFISSSLEKISNSQNFISSTPLPLVTFEVSRLLLKYPNLNSFYFNEKMISHKEINLGIAFDNGKNGLKVASIFNTNLLDLNSIEENISELSIKYNDNKLSLNEISSASFTITDLFSSGVSNFHPLVNINNSVILGICGLNNGGFNLEASFDHRISSGLEISKFLQDLKYRLEAHYNHEENNKLSLNHVKSCENCLRDINDNLDDNIKFIKVLNSNGESILCSTCLAGW
jgi:2-oxoglutarate dehydrogenase E2 component (dihydrolipoamide succinyltransferase)